jgi:microcystin-dependent protein
LAFDFPTDPVVGQVYGSAGDTYEWNGYAWIVSGGDLPGEIRDYVLKAGDSMTGPLVLPGDPTFDAEAATKGYVDAHASQIGDAPHDANSYGRMNGNWVKVVSLSGGNLEGPLYAFRDPQGPSEVATKNYVDTMGGGGGVDLSAYAPLASPVFTGVPKAPSPIDPADNKQLVTVEYVKALLASANFSTGDAKLTLKNVADPGWVMANDGTIGDATSGATTRANADCGPLFTLLWTNINNANAPVTPGGRGADAAADFAAHKKIGLTKMLGRALAIAGSGVGLTARVLGSIAGAETYTFSGGEHAAHSHGVNDPTHTHTVTTHYNYNITASYITVDGGGQQNVGLWGSYNTGAYCSASATGISIANQGNNTPFNIMQPTGFLNIMIKL